MKQILVALCLGVGLAQASDFKLSDELYREVVSGSKAPTASDPAAGAGAEWARCIELMEQGNPDGEQAMMALFKRINIFAADADIAAVIQLHEAMLKGDEQATLQLAIALIKGELGFLIFPKAPSLALPYLERLIKD
ncbi:MAG: hypothetical protein R3Y56_04720 [Akkermansia sp.]